jgi:putative methyltransferase (TIGR04325 family)
MTSAKDIVKSLTPPLLWHAARKLKPKSDVHPAYGFEGPYPSWEAAASIADGWDAPSILDKTLDAALKVRDGLVAFEMDGVPRDRIIYSPTILAFLLLVLSRQKSTLNIIDFGGGLGSNYIQNHKLLRHLRATSVYWGVVEQEMLATLGKQHFQTEELKFFPTIDDALSAAPQCDAVIFTGSLQYIAEPHALLDRIVNADVKIIAMDRLLVSPSATDGAFVQRPDPALFYPATYPVWCFAKEKFIERLTARGFTLVEYFTFDPAHPFDDCGMIFSK